MECIAKGDTLTYRVNGVVVNRATEVVPRQGKILLADGGSGDVCAEAGVAGVGGGALMRAARIGMLIALLASGGCLT